MLKVVVVKNRKQISVNYP